MADIDYKRTLAMNRNVDILRDEQKQTTFFNNTTGVQQELKILLATVKGEDPFNPNFGLDVFAITGAPDSVLRREIRIALQKDNRVQEIPNIDIQTNTNRRADVRIDIILVNDESLQIRQRIGAQT